MALRERLLQKEIFLVCTDRHWQYDSIRPIGFKEFSCGALVDANARLGFKPADPKSSDPNALIARPYTQKRALRRLPRPNRPPTLHRQKPNIRFVFYDGNSALLHQRQKKSKLLRSN